MKANLALISLTKIYRIELVDSFLQTTTISTWNYMNFYFDD